MHFEHLFVLLSKWSLQPGIAQVAQSPTFGLEQTEHHVSPAPFSQVAVDAQPSLLAQSASRFPWSSSPIVLVRATRRTAEPPAMVAPFPQSA
eukprot:3910385-Pyramimonas_sp.AAC.1